MPEKPQPQMSVELKGDLVDEMSHLGSPWIECQGVETSIVEVGVESVTIFTKDRDTKTKEEVEG